MGIFLTRQKAASLSLLFLAAIQAATIVFIGWLYYKKLEMIGAITKTYNSLISLEKINLDLHRANSQKNGFILTGFEYYLDSYQMTVKEIPAKLENFKETNSANMKESKNAIPSIDFIVEQNISGMDSILKNREVSGLEALKNTAYLGKASGIIKEFESKKVIFKNAEKNALKEKAIILRKWNILFAAGCILSIALILAELFLLQTIRKKWKNKQPI